MRLTIHNLPAHLQQPLRPVYLVTGDEPLQLGESLDLIRAAARDQGYTQREVLEHDKQFDWSHLAAEAASMSLFGDRRLLELRLSTSKIGTEGARAVGDYLQRPPDDTVLLIVSPKLERAQLSGKWVKAVDAAGALIQVWPVDARQLPGWLDKRMKSRGLRPEPGVAAWLAERVEGNLLAAAQEIEKLLLLQDQGPVTQENLAAMAGDSARYTVFDLADGALEGRVARCLRILQVLRGEGTAEPLVLWALTREVRLLATLAAEIAGGKPPQQVLGARRDIWEKRRPLYASTLKRRPPAHWMRLPTLCARTDAAIKGLEKADPWLLFEDIALAISGISLQKRVRVEGH